MCRNSSELARFRRSELILAVATAASVLLFGVLYGVLVAIALSILDLLRRVARPHDAILGFVPGVAGMHDLDDYPDADPVPGLVVYRYDAPLFFANAENFRERALAAVDESPVPVNGLLPARGQRGGRPYRPRYPRPVAAGGAANVFAMARVKQDLGTLEAAGLVGKITGPYS
jgi:hypothetical protein